MGKKRLLIAGSLVALAFGSGMYFLPQIATYQRERTCKQYNLMIQSLPPYPKPLTRIQDLHNTEREKRLFVYSIEDTLHVLKEANDQLEQLCNNLQTAEEVAVLEKVFKENGLTNVWAKHLWRRTDSDFNRLGDAEDDQQAVRDLQYDSRVVCCEILPLNKINGFLAMLPGKDIQSKEIFSFPFIAQLPKCIGASPNESLQDFHSRLYAQGVCAVSNVMKKTTPSHDAKVLQVACGFAMIDAGMNFLYQYNEGLALFGKTQLELNLVQLARKHYAVKEYIPAEAAAYLKAARVVAPTPMQALTLFMNAEDGLTGLDHRVVREYTSTKNYASRTAAFKQYLLRARRELFTEVNRFEATRTILYNAKKNFAREENAH